MKIREHNTGYYVIKPNEPDHCSFFFFFENGGHSNNTKYDADYLISLMDWIHIIIELLSIDCSIDNSYLLYCQPYFQKLFYHIRNDIA